MEMNEPEKYCLHYRIKVLWVDKTFGLAKVFFLEEKLEKVIGVGLITDKPKTQNTLSINVLLGG